jgi:hypothetical protein
MGSTKQALLGAPFLRPLLVALAGIGWASNAAADPKPLAFDPDTPIYALTERGHERFNLDGYARQLPAWLADATPLVLFVHGRGDEPAKSVVGQQGLAKGRALLHLTARGLRPVLINWDAKPARLRPLDRSRPLHNIADAATVLSEVLRIHAQQAAQSPPHRRPALLAHSMGAIVLQRVVESGSWPGGAPLFSHIVISEPDANLRGHTQWLDRLAATESVWVTWNRADIVLLNARDSRPRDEVPLGLGVPASEPMAARACYVDLSRVGPFGPGWLSHTLVIDGHLPGPSPVDDFMLSLLSGQAAERASDRAAQSPQARCVIRLRKPQK